MGVSVLSYLSSKQSRLSCGLNTAIFSAPGALHALASELYHLQYKQFRIGVLGYLGTFTASLLGLVYTYIMEILVNIDDSDLVEWQKVVDLRNNIQRGDIVQEEMNQAEIDLKNFTSSFWDKMLSKYAYLRNKRLAINAQDKYIFSWTTYTEFMRFSK